MITKNGKHWEARAFWRDVNGKRHRKHGGSFSTRAAAEKTETIVK